MTRTTSGGGPTSGTEFSADTDHLDHFVERGGEYVRDLEHVLGEIRRRRLMVGGAFGVGVGPPDLSTRSFDELIAEATLNNAFVGQIRDSLLAFTADGAAMTEATQRLDRDLQSRGLALDETDLSLDQDRQRVRGFRTAELLSAGIEPPAAARLIDDSDAYHAALALLAVGAHPDSVSGAGLHELAQIHSAAASDRGRNFQGHHLDSLLTGAYNDALHRQIIAGVVPPPDDEVRDDVVSAMAAGLSPEDIALAGSYFPSHYLRHLELSQEIAEAGNRREVADGSSWMFWDSDDEALAAVDAELAILRGERDELRRRHMIDSNGTVPHFAALAATSDATGGSRWEGQRYGFHFAGFHDSKISDGGLLFGAGRGAIKDPDGNDVELRHIGARIAADPVTAVAFYNEIGVERTANLATFLVGNELNQEEYGQFGQGLAVASSVTTPDGRTVLAFSGEQLMRNPKPPTQDQVIWYNPATLFATGEFDSSFLAGATRAALLMAEDGNDQGRQSFIGSANAGKAVAIYRGGEDPRNILVSRTAEDPAAVRSLIWSLGGPRGRAWSGVPAAGSLDPLLKPRISFDPTIGPDHEPYWLDQLLSDRITDPGHPVVDRAGFPALPSEYPITALLASAGDDSELARWIMRYSSESIDADGPMVQDPGTAAGLDLMMAKHATLMFLSGDLSAVGIEPTAINDTTDAPVEAHDWRRVYGEISRYGRGQALAGASDDLLIQSIIGAIDDDGWFEADLTRPFAHMAGRTETQAYDALIAYSATLDDTARDKNKRVNLAANATTSLIGSVPLLAPAAAATSAGWGWFFDGYPTEHELMATQEAWETEWARHRVEEWERTIQITYLDALLGPPGSGRLEVVDPSAGLTTAVFKKETLPPRSPGYSRQEPGGGWKALPAPDVPEFESLFGPQKDMHATPLWRMVRLSSVVENSFRHGRNGTSSLAAIEDTARTAEWLGEQMNDG